MWILSRDQQAIADHVILPAGLLREDGTQLQHLVFDKKRHHFGEADLLFLAVGEAGNFLALHQKLAVRRLDVTQRTRGMTYDGDWLAGSKEGLDQLDGVLVLGEIPHRAVAARIEDGVEVLLPDAVEARGLVELGFRSRVVLEPARKVSAKLGLVALGVERGAIALRGGERDLGSGILENVVGSGKLLQPEACLSPGVTQLIVGRDNHQYLHDSLLRVQSLIEVPAERRRQFGGRLIYSDVCFLSAATSLAVICDPLLPKRAVT